MHYPLAQVPDEEGSTEKQPVLHKPNNPALGLEQPPALVHHSGPAWWPPRWWIRVVNKAPVGMRSKLLDFQFVTVSTVVTIFLIVGVSVLIDGVAEMTEGDGQKSLAQCASPDGGGLTAAGGWLSTQPSSCSKQLKSYFSSDDNSNAYIPEMSSITSSALAYLTALAKQQPWAASNTRPLVVLGIDDTALSNLQYFGLGDDFRTKSGPAFSAPYNRRRGLLSTHSVDGSAVLSQGAVVGGGYGAQRSLLDDQGDNNSGTLVLGAGWGQGTNLPALPPVLQLYTQLQGLGYAVAFVTSRSESTRGNTTANLASAGYGSLCGNGRIGSQATPCYVALLMRSEGDNRLCSEVKPVLRAQLLAGGGYTLVASIGDQVSDLTGPASAPASYNCDPPLQGLLVVHKQTAGLGCPQVGTGLVLPTRDSVNLQ